MLLVAQRGEQTVSDELNVLAHQLRVHANQGNREGIGQKLLLDGNSVGDDLLDRLRVRTTAKVAEEQAREVGVHTLITADEFVGERQTRHEPTLLEPENRCEGAREENALDGRKGNEALSKGRTPVGNPGESPVCLLLDAWDRLNSIEEVLTLSGVADVGVNEERVSLRVDVFPVMWLSVAF